MKRRVRRREAERYGEAAAGDEMDKMDVTERALQKPKI